MGGAIGAVLPLGVGVSLSPIPIIAVVLMLATPRGRVNGPAFLLGWVVGLAVAGAVVLLVSGGAGASYAGAPATWVSVVKIVLAVVLLALAVRQWRHRPHGEGEAALPAWMRSIDTLGPAKTLGLGFALSALNPKNLLLTVGAAAAIAQTGISTGDQGDRTRGVHRSRDRGPGRPGDHRGGAREPLASPARRASAAGWPPTTPRSWACCSSSA